MLCTSPFCRGLSLQPNFQKGGGGGLDRPQLLEGCWERAGDLFQGGEGGLQFSHKKIKSEIFNDKKSL